MRDLSLRIETGMQGYPGDPLVRIEPALERARDGVDIAALHLGSHAGTHLDAPSHAVEGGRTTGEVAIDELVGEALVVHLGDLPRRAVVELHELRDAVDGTLEAAMRAIVVIDTGWGGRVGDEALEHPVLAAGAASWLIDHGMHVLAVDTLSPDATWAASAGSPVHEIVLGADHLIVERITALQGLPQHVRIALLPLPIDADGAPLRAVVLD